LWFRHIRAWGGHQEADGRHRGREEAATVGHQAQVGEENRHPSEEGHHRWVQEACRSGGLQWEARDEAE